MLGCGRNSKLTHVLADSLQRDSKALMIVQVQRHTLAPHISAHSPSPLHPTPPPPLPLQASPEACDAAETVCSLAFASRVRGVELNAARRKCDAAAAAKAPQPQSEVKQAQAMRAATTPNLDASKAAAGAAAAAKATSSAPTARATVTPRRLDKDTGATARRSLDKENSGGGE